MITSAETFGEMLAESVFGLANERTAEHAKVAKHWGIEPARFIREKLYLELWCVELAVTRAVGPRSAHRNRILDAFFQEAAAIGDQMKWSGMLADAAIRAESYSEAFNNPHSMGVAYTVGKAFALACNSEMDAAVILLGAQYFASVESLTEDLTRKWQRDYS